MKWGIPARFVLTFLCFLGFVCAYCLRVSLNVAIVAMVKEPDVIPLTGSNESSVACYHLITDKDSYNSSVPNLPSKGEFEWDSNMQGLVLGSFYYGYAVTYFPGGLIAGALGPKKTFGFGIFITALVSLLIPMAARWNVWALIVARVVQGIAEGASCPAVYMIISRWAPKEEITRMTAFAINGMYVGVVVSQYVSGFLCNSDILGGWPSTFYVFAFVGFLWFTLWMVLVYDFPQDHRRISEEELWYIRRGKEETTRVTSPVPWKPMLKSRVFWGLIISHITENWGFFTLLTDLPTYISNVLHVSLEVNGAINSISNIMPVVFSYFGSAIADRLIAGGRLSVTNVRKIMTSIGTYIPCLALLVIAFVGCQLEIILVCFAVAIGVNGFTQAGFLVSFMDIDPEHTGVIFGLSGGISSLTGFIAPSMVGYLIQSGNTLENWRNVLVLTSAIFFVCGTSFNILCNSKNQNWGVTNNETKVPEKTSSSPKLSESTAM